MHEIVIYGVGSALIADVEETARRAGVRIAAGIRNHEAPVRATPGYPIIEPHDIPSSLKWLPFVVALFRPGNRMAAVEEALAMGFRQHASLLDATSILPSSFAHGDGLYVNAGCVVGSASTFGKGVLVNRAAAVGHHARLGDYVSIGPGAVLAGEITIGARAIVGAGAVILPGMSVGADAVVGAGAVVTRDVPEGIVVVGNPARPQGAVRMAQK